MCSSVVFKQRSLITHCTEHFLFFFLLNFTFLLHMFFPISSSTPLLSAVYPSPYQSSADCSFLLLLILHGAHIKYKLMKLCREMDKERGFSLTAEGKEKTVRSGTLPVFNCVMWSVCPPPRVRVPVCSGGPGSRLYVW